MARPVLSSALIPLPPVHPGTRWPRRDFLRLGGAGLLGSLPLWGAARTRAAEEAAEPPAAAVPQPPLPIVDARFPCRVAEGVWLIPDKRTFLVPNVGIVEGSKAVLVIDCGINAECGRNVLEAARAIAGGRELILTVTHAHPEHTFGAQAFKGEARIYYNPLQRDYLARAGEKLLAGFRPFFPPDRAALLDGVRITLPDEVYDGSRASLDLGGRQVHFQTWGVAHSPGDQTITVPDQQVVFTGDLVEERMFPIVPFYPPMIEAADINPRAWETALTEIMRQAPRIIVPGHGNLGGPEIAGQVRDYLENTRQLAASATGAKADAPEADRQFEARIRSQHPTWEHGEFIAPALRYFAQQAAA